MAEENQFFRPIREFFQREVVSCGEDDALVDIVAKMRARGISCVVIVEGDKPKGILTDRDLRNKVVATGTAPSSLRVGEVMSSPVVTIGEDDVLYEALYRISRHNIHRLVVTDQTGALAGIITVTDILRLQAHSPHQLVVNIEKAGSIEDLRALHQRIQELIVHLSGTGIAIRDMVKLIANLNDQILIRLIELLRRDKYPELTDDFVFVVMGSEGRSEQTLFNRPGQRNHLRRQRRRRRARAARGLLRRSDRGAHLDRRAALSRRHHGEESALATQRFGVEDGAHRLAVHVFARERHDR